MNFDHKPPHIARRHERKVPGLGSLDGADLPIAPVEAVIIEPVKAAKDAVLDNSAKLETLTDKALTRLDEVLSEPITGDPKEDAVKMDGIRLVMTTQLRVDDSRLKRKQTDTLARLLERLDQEDGKLMKVVSA